MPTALREETLPLGEGSGEATTLQQNASEVHEEERTPVYERLPFLEGLRGVAALYVVLGHICSMADPSRLAWRASNAPVWLQHMIAPFEYGHLAVAAFIVLSGYCLQLALFTRGDGRIIGHKRWFIRRALRILPPYYGALALSLLVVYTVTVNQSGMPFQLYLPVTPENLLAHVFMIHNLCVDWMYKINGVMWSIGVEAQLYVLFPLLIWLIFKGGRTLTLALSAAAAIAVIVYVPGATKLYPWYLPLFVLGMVAANLAYRPSLTAGVQPALGGMIALAGFVIGGYACHHDWPIYTCDAWLGVGVAGLCYLLVVSAVSPINRFLSSRPLVSLGAFSYSLYLMHHPIEQVVYALRPPGTEGPEAIFWYLVAFGLPAMLLGSWLFSLVFEKPFISRPLTPKPQEIHVFAPLSLPLKTYAKDLPPRARRSPIAGAHSVREEDLAPVSA